MGITASFIGSGINGNSIPEVFFILPILWNTASFIGSGINGNSHSVGNHWGFKTASFIGSGINGNDERRMVLHYATHVQPLPL